MYVYKCMCVYETLRKVLTLFFGDETIHQYNITVNNFTHFLDDDSRLFLKLTSFIIKIQEKFRLIFFLMVLFTVKK